MNELLNKFFVLSNMKTRRFFEISKVIKRFKIISDYEHTTRLPHKSVENEHIVLYVINYDYKAMDSISSLFRNYFETCHMPIYDAVLISRSKTKRYTNVLGEVIKQKLCFNFVKLGCRHCAKEGNVEQLLQRLQASVPTSQKCSCLKIRELVFDSILLLRLLAAERNVTLFVPREFKIDISFTPIGIYAIVFDVSFVMSLQRRYMKVPESHRGRVEVCRASGRRRWRKGRL